MRWKNYTENTYDARLRLASVSAKLDNGRTATQAFTYDNLQRTATVNRVGDGTTTRLYLGDMVFTQTSGTITLESAGWEGGRLYSPGSTTWLTQDPLAEKYYPLTPYGYCAGSPVNLHRPRTARGQDHISAILVLTVCFCLSTVPETAVSGTDCVPTMSEFSTTMQRYNSCRSSLGLAGLTHED